MHGIVNKYEIIGMIERRSDRTMEAKALGDHMLLHFVIGRSSFRSMEKFRRDCLEKTTISSAETELLAVCPRLD